MTQGFAVLHGFTLTSTNSAAGTNGDGAAPQAAVIGSGNQLFGTAAGGGASGWGTVFMLSSDGKSFTNLYSFSAPSSSGSNPDGARPFAPLLLSANTLYGTAREGGAFGSGTVFKLDTDGTDFVTLYSFPGGGGGASPWSGLILSGTTLYGTTAAGGVFGKGTVFQLGTDGSGFSALHSFESSRFSTSGFSTNAEGASPYSGLVLTDHTLYGTAAYGGTAGNGSVFAVAADGTTFTNLHNFSATPFPYSGTNWDGANPFGSLLLVDHTLYGTTAYGGAFGQGTVFAINTDGTAFVILHAFNGLDGGHPQADLVSLDGTLYGATSTGGKYGTGTLFSLNSDGGRFSVLYDFSPVSGTPGTNAPGAFLFSGLVNVGDRLYGTASAGGDSGNGTVFSLGLQPQLTLMRSGQNVILLWPTNFSSYVLQGSSGAVPAVWTTNFPPPAAADRRFAVTNSISGTEQLFRLWK